MRGGGGAGCGLLHCGRVREGGGAGVQCVRATELPMLLLPAAQHPTVPDMPACVPPHTHTHTHTHPSAQALYDGQLFDAYFTRSFYKHMLGQALTYEDIEGVDPAYYKNLVWMLEVGGRRSEWPSWARVGESVCAAACEDAAAASCASLSTAFRCNPFFGKPCKLQPWTLMP